MIFELCLLHSYNVPDSLALKTTYEIGTILTPFHRWENQSLEVGNLCPSSHITYVHIFPPSRREHLGHLGRIQNAKQLFAHTEH